MRTNTLALGRGRSPIVDFPFSGAYVASLDVAGYGLVGDLAAETLAGCRLVWPDVCRRWLPFGSLKRAEPTGAVRVIAAEQVIDSVAGS
jgi:hypothetical protein